MNLRTGGKKSRAVRRRQEGNEGTKESNATNKTEERDTRTAGMGEKKGDKG